MAAAAGAAGGEAGRGALSALPTVVIGSSGSADDVVASVTAISARLEERALAGEAAPLERLIFPANRLNHLLLTEEGKNNDLVRASEAAVSLREVADQGLAEVQAPTGKTIRARFCAVSPPASHARRSQKLI